MYLHYCMSEMTLFLSPFLYQEPPFFRQKPPVTSPSGLRGEAAGAGGLREKAEALRKQAHMLGLLPPGERGRGGKDLRSRLDTKPRQLVVLNVEDRDQLTKYFDVSDTE